MNARKIKIDYLKAMAAKNVKEAKRLKDQLDGKILHCETFLDLMKIDDNQINNPEIEITYGKDLQRFFTNLENEENHEN